MSNSNFEFIMAIDNELKKLSPGLSISLKNGEPLTQVLDIVRFSINALINEKAKLMQESSKIFRTTTAKSHSDSVETKKTKFVNAKQELDLYEDLLAQKVKILEGQEIQFAEKLKRFEDEKANFQLEKSILDTKAHELEIRILALKDKETSLKKDLSVFANDKKDLEEEKNNILRMKQKVEENYNESEKIREVNLIAQENLQKDIKIFQVEKQILEDRSQSVSLKETYIEKLQEDIERKKRILDEEKLNNIREQEYLKELKQEISEKKMTLHEESQETERTKRFIEGKVIELKNGPISLVSEPKEILNLYNKLQSQIEVFNEEILIRETRFLHQQQKLKKDQEKLAFFFNLAQKIEHKLNETKEEISQFRREIVAEAEMILANANELCTSLNERFPMLDALYSRMHQNLFLFSSATDVGISAKDLKAKRFEVRTAANSANSFDTKMMEELMKELENKLRVVEGREKEIQNEADIMEKSSMALKLAKEKLDTAIVEIQEKEERLKVQFYNLNVGIKALSSKENEIMAYRVELDKRANLLNIKEEQMNLKSLQFQDKPISNN